MSDPSDRSGDQTVAAFAASALIVVAGLSWLFPASVVRQSVEDGPVENLTALFFLIAAGMVFVAARRLRGEPRAGRSAHPAWLFAAAVVLFVFAGEEISWAQRILGFGTPVPLGEVNRQDEFNVHNLEIVHRTFGGTHRFLSLMMLGLGLGLPILARIPATRGLIARLGIPVPSASAAVLFVGAYVYGQVFALVPRHADPDLQFEFLYSAIEVRELILAAATLLFATEILRATRSPRTLPGGTPGRA